MAMQLLHFLRWKFADDISRFPVRDHNCKMLILGSVGREGNICLHGIEMVVINGCY